MGVCPSSTPIRNGNFVLPQKTIIGGSDLLITFAVSEARKYPFDIFQERSNKSVLRTLLSYKPNTICNWFLPV